MKRQPGSYIKDKSGKLAPNLGDEAMAAREKAVKDKAKEASNAEK